VKLWHPAALLVAASLAACGHSETTESVKPEPPKAITAEARELVTAIVDDWTATRATLRRYKREGTGWKIVGAPWQGVVGRAGTAWGSGVHGSGVPQGREGPQKREGDGKSPAGVFTFGASYGYATAAPSGTRVRYTAVDDAWKCVDDPASKAYNRVLDQRTTSVDWKSAEDMKRPDELYRWVLDVGHNTSRVPSGGSCIFLHVWNGPDGATLGCTAMAESVLAELIATLDPSAMFVLLPRAEYAALATSWGLPPLHN
jgi:L,D-peptidoglycan transpeptidase YkuD (ErfK/YbiS/YcfS/YnhG family)